MQTEDKNWLVYNLISEGLAILSPGEYLLVKNILEKNNESSTDSNTKELEEALIKGRFLIEDYIDEVKILRTKYLKNKYNQSCLHLTIFPTLECNFNCIYCYQNQLSKNFGYNSKGKMPDEVKEAIIEYLRKAAYTTEQLIIDWFGVEPLLEIDSIVEMSMEIKELCEDNSCEYQAFITTNGFLLTPEISAKLKRSGVIGLMITIDGPPEVHNRNRPLKSGDGTFDTIIDNIKKSIDYFQNINLRINVDQSNISNLENLLLILKENNLNQKKIRLVQHSLIIKDTTSQNKQNNV